MNIYLDVDDVIADFTEYAKKYLNSNWENLEVMPSDEWQKFKLHQRMYNELPLKSHANDLVQWCKTYTEKNKNSNLFFLTAVPRNNDVPWAFYDKVMWCHKNFPGIPVFFGPYSKDKWVRCKVGDILIDDRLSNCEDWEKHGGISYLYKNWNECKIWLEKNLPII